MASYSKLSALLCAAVLLCSAYGVPTSHFPAKKEIGLQTELQLTDEGSTLREEPFSSADNGVELQTELRLADEGSKLRTESLLAEAENELRTDSRFLKKLRKKIKKAAKKVKKQLKINKVSKSIKRKTRKLRRKIKRQTKKAARKLRKQAKKAAKKFFKGVKDAAKDSLRDSFSNNGDQKRGSGADGAAFPEGVLV